MITSLQEMPDSAPSYRAYLIGEDDRVATFKVILADSDPAAVEQALQFIDQHPVELWDRRRLIAKLPRKYT